MPLPTTTQLQSWFHQAYQLLGVVADEVTLRYRESGNTWSEVGPIKGKVSALKLSEIVAGSTARVGDLRVILDTMAIPAGQRRMELKDRVLWRGREYAVVDYDDATASIGADQFAVWIIIRG